MAAACVAPSSSRMGGRSRSTTSSQTSFIRNSKHADIDHTLFATQPSRSSTRSNSTHPATRHSRSADASQSVVSTAYLNRLGVNNNSSSSSSSSSLHAPTALNLNSKDTVVIARHDLNSIRAAAAGEAIMPASSSVSSSAFRSSSSTSFMSPSSSSSSSSSVSPSLPSSSAPTSSVGSPTPIQLSRMSEKARIRKDKMMRMEKERLESGEPSNEIEAEEQEKRSLLLNRAKSAMDEELDDVKHMNQMTLYAKCVTIRDAQILEKQKIQEEQIAEEKRLDMMMEVERVKTLKMQEEREMARVAEQRLGASVIISQIAEREAERIRQQELREQESSLMLQRVQQLEEQAEQERLAKVAAGRRLLQEVMEANNAQARAKLRRKQEEEEEDRKIAVYLRQKEEREREQEAAKEKERQEKELEISRLRAAQERAQDRQAAVDELRAKRYQESKDRQWRHTQLDQAMKREQIRQEIADAREHQRDEKQKRITEQALQEKFEYIRVLEWQQQQNEADEKKLAAGKAKAAQHRVELLKQIELHEAEKMAARARYLEEGKQMAAQQEGEKKKLLKLKHQKLETLEKAGVPEKYRAELAKKKVLVASIH